MTRRVLGAGALILCLVTVLTGCSPRTIGTVGVQRNADGSLSVLIRVCRDSVDELALRYVNTFPHGTDGAPALPSAVVPAHETGPRPIRSVTVPLDPAVTFAADVPFPAEESALDTSIVCELRASSTRGNATSGLFGAVELQDLQPGEVTADIMGRDPDPESIHRSETGGIFVIVTQEQFERRVRALCG